MSLYDPIAASANELDRQLTNDLEDEEDYKLAPISSRSRGEVYSSLIDPATYTVVPEFDDEDEGRAVKKPDLRIQFSLWHLFGIMTFASIGLAGARIFSPPLFAFFTGITVLVGLWYASKADEDNAAPRMILLGTLSAYVAALIAVRFVGGP